ncbi:gamma-glutamyltransferase [Patulibacter sp. SYSU D01012]|uniref:gamma-glutamyltransferase n=1 Tax=Patulibacter sp. SYSU D01012 TaxID=2817381 RepID=UPI001B3019BA|nr:gamma-glutamyltransferase [Patulibacter sp. SYSU D01012]
MRPPSPTVLRRAALGLTVPTLAAAALAPAARADGPAVASGTGGAVASVDRDATDAGLRVLRQGGNAVDAAIATAAALGVTEPYSAGVGGGGYMVVWDARRGRAVTIDGRETAPRSLGPKGFLDPRTKKPRDFDDLVTSGLSVGVPGTPLTWAEASRRLGRLPLRRALAPATTLAAKGFRVDQTFRDQTLQNKARFARFPSTRRLFLPGGTAHRVGQTLKNPDLARTYRLLARDGVDALYRGAIGRDVVRTVRRPPVRSGRVLRGGMTTADLRRYDVRVRGALRSTFRDLEVVGMPPSSSGGIAIAEALNVVEALGPATPDRVQALHRYLEASRIAYADRSRWVGDDRFVDVPTAQLLSKPFAASRACLIRPDATLKSPLKAGAVGTPGAAPACGTPAPDGGASDREGDSTTHLVAADRWGNVVSYTLTIEQTGGSGIVVPGRGFLLNNELTDFDPAPAAGLTAKTDPNLPGPGKRPRSSMSPTIVLRGGQPWLAVGSPGGATIITTVLQTLLNRIDGGMTLPDAVAAPRISQRNAPKTEAEPTFLQTADRRALEGLGQAFTKAPPTFTPDPEIGAVAALERQPGNAWQAVAEPERRGGGAAGVVTPAGR